MKELNLISGLSNRVSKSDLENDLLFLKGSIPGSKNTEVLVKQSVKNIRKLTMSFIYLPL